MKAYKGFNKDMTCRDFQYEEGKTYETDKAEICETGFHACEDPIDCFGYYAPGQSVYHEVEIEDNGQRNTDDTKVVGKKIKIGAKIGVPQIAQLHIEYVKSKIEDTKTNTGNRSAATNTGNYSAATNTGYYSAATNTGYYSAATNTGNRSAATNTGNYSAATNTGNYSAATNTGNYSAATNTGYRSAATNTGYYSAATNTGYFSAATNTGDRSAAINTGNYSAATNTGYCSAATNTGNYSAATNTGNCSTATVEGKNSVAIATGFKSKVKSTVIGSAIVVVERDDNHNLVAIQSAIVDGEIIKAGTWYACKNGKLVEVKDDEM